MWHNQMFLVQITSEKLEQFLQVEGKTMEDIQMMCASTAWNSPESIIHAVGNVLNTKQSDSNNYRRLRTFSGVSPIPPGEGGLDSWLEQAKFMIEECECSEKEKRCRIVKSLKRSSFGDHSGSLFAKSRG